MKILHSSRLLAIAIAGVLSASVLLQPAPARADKAKNYKYGAIALGAVGGYLLSKGKTVEGAAVLGAGAYTYKKGEDARKAAKNDDPRYGDRYGYNNSDRYNYDNGYDDSYNYGDDYAYNDRYNVPDRNRLGNRGDNRNSDYRANNYNSDRNRDRDRNRNRDDNDRSSRRGYSSRNGASNGKIRAR